MLKSKNQFDNLRARFAQRRTTAFRDELTMYLSTDPEATEDPIAWWYARCKTFPRLSRMALNYLTIPGMSSFSNNYQSSADNGFITATLVDIKRVFSRGRLILPHVHNGLSSQSIRALLYLGEWSLLGLIKDDDTHRKVASLGEVDGDDDIILDNGWDDIVIPR